MQNLPLKKEKLQTLLYCNNHIALKLCWTLKYTIQYAILHSLLFLRIFSTWSSMSKLAISLTSLCFCQCLYPVRVVKYVLPPSTTRVTYIVDGSYCLDAHLSPEIHEEIWIILLVIIRVRYNWLSQHLCSTVTIFNKSKKTSKLRVTGLCVRNSPVTGEFLAQRASNTENVSIWWRHRGNSMDDATGYHQCAVQLIIIQLM